MDKRFSVLALLVAPLVVAENSSNYFISSTFGSNMVLQRDVSASIYGGAAAANVTIECEIDGKVVQAISSSDSGVDYTFPWVCSLPIFPGSFDQYVINVTSPATKQWATLENVVFGDVFLCGGQSNMQFAMPAMFDGETEISDADDYPFIRVMSVGQDEDSTNLGMPMDNLQSVDLPWSIGSASVMTNGATDDEVAGFGFFSAVCYETGKNIFNDFLNSEIPVGLVSANWGGSEIETWISENAAQACGDPVASKAHKQSELKASEDGDDTPDFQTTPGINFNNIINPFHDMVFKSVFWYQGESNIGNSDMYQCLQDNMMEEWRTLPGFKDVSNLYVQLAPWSNGGSSAIADMRWAQYTVLYEDDNSFMVSAADLGDPDSPYGDIHPRNKMEVARRLALAAGTALYDVPAPHMGPEPLMGAALDDGSFGAYLKFSEDSVGEGLKLQDPQVCPDTTVCGYHYLVYPTAGNVLVGSIEINGNILNMYPETPQTEKPTGIQYGYNDYPMLTIYNSYDTPLIPFAAPLPFVMDTMMRGA